MASGDSAGKRPVRQRDRETGLTIRDALGLASGNLVANPLRTILTLLGIVIGISAIIIVIAVINGLNRYIEQKINNFGRDVFVVSRIGIITNRQKLLEAQKHNRKLKRQDSEALRKRCRSCSKIGSETHASTDVKKGSQEILGANIGGVSPEIIEIEPYEIALGRNISYQETAAAARVAFVGQDVVATFFRGGSPLGKRISLRGLPFVIIGVAKRRGSVFGFSRDKFVKIPITTHARLFGSRRSVNISVKSRAGYPVEECVDEVRMILRARHHLGYHDEDDFGMVTSDGVNALWSSLTRIIFSVALFVVGISLVVGGIVIMNIMLVSVIERTREIGVRKAIGATHRDVIVQFLTESILLCLAGGVIGILIAFLFCQTLSTLTDFPAELPLFAPVLAFLLSTAVGLFFGVHPAKRAAMLNPIEALRAE